MKLFDYSLNHMMVTDAFGICHVCINIATFINMMYHIFTGHQAALRRFPYRAG